MNWPISSSSRKGGTSASCSRASKSKLKIRSRQSSQMRFWATRTRRAEGYEHATACSHTRRPFKSKQTRRPCESSKPTNRSGEIIANWMMRLSSGTRKSGSGRLKNISLWSGEFRRRDNNGSRCAARPNRRARDFVHRADTFPRHVPSPRPKNSSR